MAQQTVQEEELLSSPVSATHYPKNQKYIFSNPLARDAELAFAAAKENKPLYHVENMMLKDNQIFYKEQLSFLDNTYVLTKNYLISNNSVARRIFDKTQATLRVDLAAKYGFFYIDHSFSVRFSHIFVLNKFETHGFAFCFSVKKTEPNGVIGLKVILDGASSRVPTVLTLRERAEIIAWLDSIDFQGCNQFILPDVDVFSQRNNPDVSRTQRHMESAKTAYLQAVAAAIAARQDSTLVTEQFAVIQGILNDLPYAIKDLPNILGVRGEFHAWARERGHVISIVFMRQQSNMVPYDGSEDAVKYLIDKNGNSNDLDPDVTSFIMPPAYIAISLNLDQKLLVSSSNVDIKPVNANDGVRDAYWGSSSSVHPHCPGDGSQPCLGDYEVPIADALSNFDIVSAINMIELFCQVYNQHDIAGSSVVNWQQAI